MTFPVFPGSNPSGYNLTRSLRLRASASAYLSRTPASASNRRTWTWSGWVKRGALSFQGIFTGKLVKDDTTSFYYASDKLWLLDRPSNVTNISLSTDAVYRDPSAWYHVVLAVDTTNATSTDRIKVYVNNTRQTLSGTYPSLNYEIAYINNTQIQALGVFQDSSGFYFDGYLTEVNFIDGQALTPSFFGSTNTLTGVWQPARYTGTYGTNGFYLPFTDNSALTTSSNVGLGKDFSGNGNYWTTNNISITSGTTYDSMTDVPTLTSATAANFAVLNPLTNGSYTTLSGGNLNTVGNTSSNNGNSRSTFAVSTGLWYAEFTVTNAISGYPQYGIMKASDAQSPNNGLPQAGYGSITNSVAYVQDGTKIVANSSSSYGSSFTTNDVIGVALDATNGAVYFSKNGTWQNSGVPTSGSSKTGAALTWTGGSAELVLSIAEYNASSSASNFGQRPFTYTPPTGYVALNTYNLPTSTVLQGSQYMNAGLYIGTGSATALPVTGPANPDFVWIKSRSAATSHSLLDSLRSTATPYSLRLYSNATNAEYNYGASLLTTTSTGFNLTTTDADHNTNGATYVAWQWQAGQGTTSSNTSGTITSTVSVNASAGFSVATFTSTGAAGITVGHGLGVVPAFFIVKSRGTTGNWLVYHQSLGNTGGVALEQTAAFSANAGYWNNTSPTSSVFTLGTFTPATTCVAYCWTPIAGYSAFGSYTGNGSSNGPFVYTGFRPRFILYKRTDTGGSNWYILDTARSPYNVSQTELVPNSAIAEFTSSNASIDVNSNGFKVRTTDTDRNASGGTYIYAAFAEVPFKNSLAR